jgi:diaminopimelate decarboxylase
VVLDSAEEAPRLGAVARKLGIRQPALLRVTPGVTGTTHAYRQTGQLDSKFGVPISTGQAEAALAAIARLEGIDLVGLHVHIGSQIRELTPFRDAVAAVWQLVGRLEGWRPRLMSAGGGLGIAYQPEDQAPAISDYVRAVAEAMWAGARSTSTPLPALRLEPGRSISGPAGLALYRVGVTKDIPLVRRYAAVDGGMGDNLRPALYGSRYLALLDGPAGGRPHELQTIAGRYCESGDILIKDILLPRLQPGDLVVLLAAGAYTLSMASQYNAVPRPAVAWVEPAGRARLVRRRERQYDLWRTERTRAAHQGRHERGGEELASSG